MTLFKRPKPRVSITGILVKRLRLGRPAVYLYNGELIRTTSVQAILENTPECVCFETREGIYELSSDTYPLEGANSAA